MGAIRPPHWTALTCCLIIFHGSIMKVHCQSDADISSNVLNDKLMNKTTAESIGGIHDSSERKMRFLDNLLNIPAEAMARLDSFQTPIIYLNPVLGLKPGFCKIQKIAAADKNYRRECKEFNNYHVKFIFSLFCIIAWGAIVRSVLRATHLCIPYTVVLMITGLLIGIGSRVLPNWFESGCEHWTVYTKIARMPPQIILYVFLPVLIFESAFSMNSHVFLRSATQILVAALPGMLITTFITALVCQNFFLKYKWGFFQAALFGSIISATDPVAVVAILKELGTSEALSTMIEGESLLNDGIAILLYEIFKEIVETEQGEGIELHVLQKFCQITLGGPAFGFIMAKIAIFSVSLIFNDATVEITITLVAAYLTYYVGEAILGVSGVMAVVVLGIVMSAERTSISPEVETLVHHFWEMLGYLANTVLFVLVGIVITETAIISLDPGTDLGYLAFLYVALSVARLFMILVLSPCLSRLGYGMTWPTMLVMMWGGLRGAVGICLSLEVYTNTLLCGRTNIGPKFLLQTAGIVFLTLVVNGTTTQALLDCLKITEISIGRIQDMNNAHKQISGAQVRTIAVLKNDRFLADAKWELVEKFTSIDNPYAKQKKNRKVAPEEVAPILEQPVEEPRELADLPAESEADAGNKNPSLEEYKEMTEEARLRCLKALKVSFWRQYEQGVLTDLAVQILRNAASAAEDKPLCIIRARDLNKYWVLHGVFPWLQIQLTKKFGKEEVLPDKPRNGCRRCCWYIATSDWFEYFIMGAVLLNLVPAIWETYIIAMTEETKIDSNQRWTFFGVNLVFFAVYIFEALIKLLGRGLKDYFCKDKWNYVDLMLLVASVVDIMLALLTFKDVITIQTQGTQALKFVRTIRVLRAFRLLRPLVPAIMKAVDKRINEQLFLGYDVGKGFVTAVDDVIKFLPQMIIHPRILHRLRTALEHERLQTVREMGMLQKGHPVIAIAVKTRHASRTVLNQMRDALMELKEDGLIDEKENMIILLALEEKMKRLWHSPATIPPFPPETLLENMSWVFGNEDILEYVKQHAQLISYTFGEVISEVGDPPDGIYVIVSGMVKIQYVPVEATVKAYEQHGIVPNVELFLDLTFQNSEYDFFSTGTIVGEKSVLTEMSRAAIVSCETVVTAYHLPQEPMKAALEVFADPYDSLESRMWRSYGIRLATALLPTQPAYSSWTLDKIRMHLERSAVPVGERFDTMIVPEYISDVIVIHGRVMNYHTHEVYQAPALIPRTCSKFSPVEGEIAQPRVLVVAHEEIDHEEDVHSAVNSLHNMLIRQNVMEERPDMASKSILMDHRRKKSYVASKVTMKNEAKHPKKKGIRL